jgi:hypothetical protein
VANSRAHYKLEESHYISYSNNNLMVVDMTSRGFKAKKTFSSLHFGFFEKSSE